MNVYCLAYLPQTYFLQENHIFEQLKSAPQELRGGWGSRAVNRHEHRIGTSLVLFIIYSPHVISAPAKNLCTQWKKLFVCTYLQWSMRVDVVIRTMADMLNIFKEGSILFWTRRSYSVPSEYKRTQREQFFALKRIKRFYSLDSHWSTVHQYNFHEN